VPLVQIADVQAAAAEDGDSQQYCPPLLRILVVGGLQNSAIDIITSGRAPPRELDFTCRGANAVRVFSACTDIGAFGYSLMESQ
jgi:hypothetical protein